MNSHIPTSSDNDDIEFLPNLIKEYSFCREDQVAYIQCRQVSNEASYDQGADNLTVCNTKAGFACYASLQGDRNCEDYEVRVYCQCADAGKEMTPQSIRPNKKIPIFRRTQPYPNLLVKP